MKKIISICLCMCLGALAAFAQSFDEEAGMRYYRNGDYAEALPCLQRAAKDGSAKAQDFLGYMYETGKGTVVNYQVAMNLYKRAAGQGYGPAMVSIGRLYQNGSGVEKSPSLAFGWYQKGAEAGSAEGKFETALCHLYGYGTPQDETAAFLLFKESAPRGYGEEYLGDMYYEGRGTRTDYEQAFRWYTQEDVVYTDEAQYRVAEMYAKGLGTDKDLERALEILEELKDEGFEKADALYAEVGAEQEDAEFSGDPEEMPEFPGGLSACMAFISKNLQYPKVCQENGVQGKVIVQFTVDKEGNIVNPVVIRSVDPYLDQEALRLIRMMPKWKPGRQKGRPVSVRYTFPFNFRLG